MKKVPTKRFDYYLKVYPIYKDGLTLSFSGYILASYDDFYSFPTKFSSSSEDFLHKNLTMGSLVLLREGIFPLNASLKPTRNGQHYLHVDNTCNEN